MTEIVVRLRDEAADRWNSGADDSETAMLRAVLSGHGVVLRDQNPGASDPQLRSWYTVTLPDASAADRLAASLRALDAVDAAYVQPRPSPA